MKKENIIVTRSFEFALAVIDLYRQMIVQKEFVISKQLLRSGTSIGANVQEATAAISKKDFTAKMSIASKEARETKYWLQLLEGSSLVDLDFSKLIEEADQLINILTAIVKTSQNNVE